MQGSRALDIFLHKRTLDDTWRSGKPSQWPSNLLDSRHLKNVMQSLQKTLYPCHPTASAKLLNSDDKISVHTCHSDINSALFDKLAIAFADFCPTTETKV